MTATHEDASSNIRGHGPLSPRYSEAFVYAATIHRDQIRKGTRIPYISHLMAVSALVLEDGGTEDQAIGALLHDAAEDCGREVLTHISAEFGEKVALIVEGCSDDLPEAGAEKRPWALRKSGYLLHLTEADESVLLVSAADKAHNASATAVDLPRTGWPKANACHHRVLWWYDALDRVISERLPKSRSAALLHKSVETMFAHTPEVPRAEVAGGWPPKCDCLTAEDAAVGAEHQPSGTTTDPREDVALLGPATDLDEINAEWDPAAIAEAEWEGRQ